MQMKPTYRLLTAFCCLGLGTPLLRASDNDIKDNEFNPVNTGVTTLSITPDARGSAMGNLGAATDPDMNSQFWNASKYAFGYSTGGLSFPILLGSARLSTTYSLPTCRAIGR